MIHESGDLPGAMLSTLSHEKEWSMVRVVVTMVLVLGLARPLLAQEPGEEIKKVEPVVVTATKIETSQAQLGAAVTVITDEEIRELNFNRLEEALRQVPGVEVQTSGSPGKATSIRIRGSSPQQVLVLFDGLRIQSPTLGSTDLAELTLNAIDRIEIVRGPQSTLYGADAIGGVVNIITKKGQGPPSSAVWLEGGNYGTFHGQANVQGAYKGFNFNLTGGYYRTAGQFENDESKQPSLTGRVGYDFPWGGELAVSGMWSQTKLQLPISSTSPTVFDPNSRNDLETWLFNIAYVQKIFDWWSVRGRYGQWANNSDFRDAPPPSDDIVIGSEIDTRRLEAELLNTFTMGKWNTLTVGLEARQEYGRNRTTGDFPTSFSTVLNTFSVFAQDEISLFDRLFLGGGIRWEDNDVFGTSLTGRASAAFLIKETGSKLRFAWGQGFRAPTINDLFFPGFGNPDLKPEQSVSWEFGVDQKLWKDRVRLGGTYFHSNFTDLIQVAFDPTTGFFIPSNVGEARIQGFEAYATVDPLPWLSGYVNYTYLDAKDLETGRELRRVPRNTWNVGAAVTPHERLRLFIQANVVSSQLESDFAGRNPRYYRIDVGGTWRILGRAGHLAGIELTARINNVTNQRYDEVLGFPALGINAMAGLRAYFD